MASYIQDAYWENDVLEADGCRLVELLYRAAVEAIAQARVHLERGEIQARSRQITKAQEILNELAVSLDHAAGGELSRTLAELYDYLQRLLIEANFKQADPPLAEAQALLTTILEGWEQCSSQASLSVAYAPPVWESAYEPVPLDCLG
jgi:flagellar protein FliS